MAPAARPRTRLPLMLTALAALLAIALAGWLVFGRQPKTVEDEATMPLPPAAPAPMPYARPATPSAP